MSVLDKLFFQNKKEVIYKRVLVSDVLDHIRRIYSPLNLADMKLQKFRYVRNTASDDQRIFNFMRNPKLARILVVLIIEISYNTIPIESKII